MKVADLRRRLAEKKGLVIGYSGGVDSGFLMIMANEVMGKKAVAILIDSPTVPRADLALARKCARDAGARFETVSYDVLNNSDFVSNDTRRCYHCRKGMMTILRGKAAILDIETVATGTTMDDASDFRPGLEAEKEEGIWHPLVESDFTKEDVREALRTMNITWSEKPASPCLSSRIAYGNKISKDRLRAVERAEELLRSRGFKVFRVRVHADVARLEISPEEMTRFIRSSKDWSKISSSIRKLGFKFVCLDLEGYKSGNLNRSLKTA
jgi:pyridinium-3,5-biscarboxylic acid mononucleotide sulfurtransferase